MLRAVVVFLIVVVLLLVVMGLAGAIVGPFELVLAVLVALAVAVAIHRKGHVPAR